MNKRFHSERILAVPILAAIVLGLILMTAILPMVKMSPKNIPVGLVVEDAGPVGSALADNLLQNAPEIVKFTRYDSVEQLQSAMNDRKAYGALVLPADFSATIGTLQSGAPEKATAIIYVNEGANATVSSLMQNALTNMVSMLNARLSAQMLSAGTVASIEPDQVRNYANPVQPEIVKVHPTGDLGNAPLSFLTGTWFTSLIGAIALYLYGNKRKFASRAEKYRLNLLQTVLPFVYALVAGYVLAAYSVWLYGFEYESFNKVALFIAIVVAAFIFMIFATLRWLKLPSIVIYVLLMFFSMPSVQLAPEMLPGFYRDYLFSWLPIRIYAEGVREVLFFGKNLINGYSVTLIGVLVAGLVLVWLKNVTERTETA